jgi:hypothetical protein
MKERSLGGSGDEDPPEFGRRLRYALIVYAVVEFVALAFVVCYKAAR